MAFRAVRIGPSGRLAAQTRRWRSVEGVAGLLIWVVRDNKL